jgi:predicted alpha/beta superfamily hydrolase
MLSIVLAGASLTGLGAASAQAATIHYRSGWRAPRVHFEAGGAWTAVPGLAMADEGGGWHTADTGAAALGEFLFNDGGGRWDHAPGGRNYVAPPGARELWVQDGRVTLAPPEAGRFEWFDFSSRALGGKRHVVVYLPAWYDRRPSARYPVLYLQDGQNLFDPGAFWGGWAAQDAADAAAQGGAEQIIIVGIDNSPARMDEYTPVYDASVGAGGGADRYLDFVAGELKPEIDRRYRTRADAASSGFGGSSLGGLLALYAGVTRPGSFGRILAMSPSIWWGNRWIMNLVGAMPRLPKIKVYLDSGGARDGATDCFAMRDLLEQKGLAFGSTLWHWYEPGAEHNEAAWRARLPRAIADLYGR